MPKSGAAVRFRAPCANPPPGLNPGSTVFGHLGEAWGYAVGAGVRQLLAAARYPRRPGQLLPWRSDRLQRRWSIRSNFTYGTGNTGATGLTADGIFTNGGQIELTNAFNWALGCQHYWSPQWTAVVGGQPFAVRLQRSINVLRPSCWYVPFAANGIFVATPGTFGSCNPNFRQDAISTVLPGTRIRSWTSVWI